MISMTPIKVTQIIVAHLANSDESRPNIKRQTHPDALFDHITCVHLQFHFEFVLLRLSLGARLLQPLYI